MSTEKTDALVIRQADFSESSRVLTLFTRDFGKVSCLAKGAKRLRSSFEVSLDLLTEVRIVYIPRSSGSLNLLTEAQLIKRFEPFGRSLTPLYSGYYVAELLNALSEEGDPHPELYDAACSTLRRLETDGSPLLSVSWFELAILREIGQLPDLDSCTICHSPVSFENRGRFWVSQSGLICSKCGRSEYEASELHPGSLAILRTLLDREGDSPLRVQLDETQRKEIRRVLVSAVSHVLGRRPKTLSMLQL